MNTTPQYFFGVIDQQGTPSQYSEQGQNITAYGVVYKKTFSVKLSVPYSTSQHSLLYRVIATLCYSLNRDEIPACGLEQGRNFSYEIFPENENTLQVRCIINVLSSQHNKAHFRIRFQLADTHSNEILLEYTTWTNPIWVVSKSKLTAGSNRSSTRKVRSSSASSNLQTPASSSSCFPATTSSASSASNNNNPDSISSPPLPSDMGILMDLLSKVLKGQEQQQEQLNTLIRHQTNVVDGSASSEDNNNNNLSCCGLKRSYDEIEGDIDNAFRHIKKPRHGEDREILKKIAEKYQDEIRLLYELLPESTSSSCCSYPVDPAPSATAATAAELCPVNNSVVPTPQTAISSPPGPTGSMHNISGIDFPDVEFFPQLDEFVWTE